MSNLDLFNCKNRKPGSGSKENVGRHKTPYETKTLYKRGVPVDIYDKCLSLVDAEILKFKNK